MADKKLRILHAAVSMNPSAGVISQMEREEEAAGDLQIPWKVFLHTPKDVKSKIVLCHKNLPNSKIGQYIILRLRFYRWLREVQDEYDLILLRHSVHDVFEAWFSRDFGYKILTVHHTLEMPELAGGGGILNHLKSILEEFIGKYSLRKSIGVIGVTREILDFESKRVFLKSKIELVYPNGIECIDQRLVDARQEIPEVIFVAANFSFWHGLDLLLDEASLDSSNCRIHVVGNMSENLERRCKLDSRFILHGTLSTQQINQLMTRAWCGLSSFGLFRQHMNDACTLKVREYLAAGLPVYSGHKDSGLPSEFIYYKVGEPKISSIVEFALKHRFCDKNEIYEAAKEYISKKNILKNLYVSLRKID